MLGFGENWICLHTPTPYVYEELRTVPEPSSVCSLQPHVIISRTVSQSQYPILAISWPYVAQVYRKFIFVSHNHFHRDTHFR